MNEESKFVNFRKRKPASDEEKSRDRAMHRVENLPEHRLVEVRDADRANSESKTKMHIFFKTRQNQSHLIGIHNFLTLSLSLLF